MAKGEFCNSCLYAGGENPTCALKKAVRNILQNDRQSMSNDEKLDKINREMIVGRSLGCKQLQTVIAAIAPEHQ